MVRQLAFVVAALAGACVQSREDPTPDSMPEATAPVAAAPTEAPKSPAELEVEACLDKRRKALAEPSLPGDPPFEANRPAILARAKATPVLLRRAPHASAGPVADRVRKELSRPEFSAYELYEYYPTLVRNRDRAREVLLTDGYLYAPTPGLALALSNVVRLHHLFRDDEIWIHRGGRMIRAVRERRNGVRVYVYAEGPESGRLARLLLLDRVSADRADLTEPLHVDVQSLARASGFEEIDVERITESAIVAKLRYDKTWVPALLAVDGATTRLDCEVIAARDTEVVARARDRTLRREAILARHRAVVRAQIEERLPFDEPKTEVGQQDGKLRQEWVQAYRYGASTFEFNRDKYRVFDAHGRPKVPQVCIDFITDTLERAGGSWYQPRGEPRRRLPGRLRFDDYGVENVRSVESFVEFAKAHPNWFDVYQLPPDQRIPLIRRKDFYDHLYEHRDRYRPGDIITILGLRDDGKQHYHSFFVYEADPVTGMPTLVAANAGRPRVRTWDNEMANAPLRSIRTRIRPRLEWLESVTLVEPTATAGSEAEPRVTPI